MDAVRRGWRALVVQRGDRRWDLLVRGTGLIGLLGIPVALFLPVATPLVWFALLAVPANSPLSPILPTAFEPLIMEAAKHSAAIWVTVVGTAVYMYMEYLNYHLYAWVLDRDRFAKLREKKWVERSVGFFTRSPFVTVVVFAFTPLPFWVVRILSIYGGYSVPRFMVACALGRFPRIFIYAWLGAALAVPGTILLVLALGSAVLIVAMRLARGQAVIEDTVLDMKVAEPAPAEESQP